MKKIKLFLLMVLCAMFSRVHAQTKTSNASGNWNSAAIWTPTGVPTSTDNVLIANGTTVSINANVTINSLTVGTGGTAAELRLTGNTARTVSVSNGITIGASGSFTIPSNSNATHNLTIGGNIINNGAFSLFTDANSLCNTTFMANGNQSVSGSGALTRFNRITLNMGSSANNVLDISSTSFVTASNFLTLTNGTFKLSTSSSVTLVPFPNSAVTISGTGGIWMNSPSSIISFSAGINLSGLMRVSAGTVDIGNANNEDLTPSGGTLTVEGGLLLIAGKYNASTTATMFNLSGGTVSVSNNGSTNTTISPFHISAAGSTFNMTGGTIILPKEGGTGGQDLGFLNTGSTGGAVTGGTLQLGTATTPANQTITINSSYPIPNLVVNSASVTAKLLTNSLTVLNDISVSSGTIRANNINISLGGNWNNAGTFAPGTNSVIFSGASQTINRSGGENFNHLVFSGSGTKTFSSAITASGNISISSGCTVDVGAANQTVTLRGSFFNNGYFDARSGLVTLSGTSSQTLGGTTTTTFNDLTLNNAAGAVLASAQNLKGTLSLASGTLNLNSQTFTLLSDASATGRIGPISGTGNITGNVTIQRFVPGGYTGWAFLGAPISSGLTLNDWDDDIYISCPTCPDGSAGGFLSIYTYDETQPGTMGAAASYVGLSTINDAIQPNKGYWVYLGTGPVTTSDIVIDVTGPVRKGGQSIPLNYTNNGSAANDGWNLIQNPYPSAISWAALKGATSNIDNAIYVYNADLNSGSGGYATYVNGVSSPAVASGGIDDNIAMCQAFYVHSTGATALSAQETNKVSNNPTFLRPLSGGSARPMVRLKLTGLNKTDETVVYFEQGATKNFEYTFDSYKIPSNDPLAPQIVSHFNNLDFQINGVQPLGGFFSIPIKATTGVTGNFTINATQLTGIPNGACVTLYDRWTQASIDLRTGSHTFNLPDTTSAPRFEFRITLNSLNIASQVKQPSCTEPASGFIVAHGLSQGPWNYTWKNNGSVVKTSVGLVTADSLKQLSGGTIEVEVTTPGLCDENDSQFTLIAQVPVVAGFMAVDTLYLNLQSGVQFSSTASGASSYQWFSDYNNQSSTGASPLFYYDMPGSYYVKQICTSSSGCVDSVQKKLVVADGLTGIKTISANKTFIVKNKGNGLYAIESLANAGEKTSAALTDIVGNVLRNYPQEKDPSFEIDLNGYPKGVYFLTVRGDTKKTTIKLLAE